MASSGPWRRRPCSLRRLDLTARRPCASIPYTDDSVVTCPSDRRSTRRPSDTPRWPASVVAVQHLDEARRGGGSRPPSRPVVRPPVGPPPVAGQRRRASPQSSGSATPRAQAPMIVASVPALVQPTGTPTTMAPSGVGARRRGRTRPQHGRGRAVRTRHGTARPTCVVQPVAALPRAREGHVRFLDRSAFGSEEQCRPRGPAGRDRLRRARVRRLLLRIRLRVRRRQPLRARADGRVRRPSTTTMPTTTRRSPPAPRSSWSSPTRSTVP